MPHETVRSSRAALLLAFLCIWGPIICQDTGMLLMQGDSLLDQNKPQRALELFDQALKAEPSARTYLARAKAYYALERNDRFVLDIERALQLDSTLAEAHYLRSLYALRAQDMAKATHHAGRAIQHSEDEKLTAMSHIIRGLGHADRKMQREAISDLEHGLKAGIEDLEAMRVLARSYDAAGRHEDALVILERLTTLEPDEVGHWSNRAFELIQLGRLDEGLVRVEKALELDKDEPVTLSNRAYIYYQMGRDKEAMQDVERSLKAYPANAHALRTRALLHLRKGQQEKACEDLTLARVLMSIPEVDSLLKEHCAASRSPQKKR